MTDFFEGDVGVAFPAHPEFRATTEDVHEHRKLLGGGRGSPRRPHGSGNAACLAKPSFALDASPHAATLPLPPGNHKATALLGDVRSSNEFLGICHDYPYFDALGRVPVRFSWWFFCLSHHR